jgi:hypothetical protein
MSSTYDGKNGFCEDPYFYGSATDHVILPGEGIDTGIMASSGYAVEGGTSAIVVCGTTGGTPAAHSRA